jgi:hypothetical protein
MYAGNRNINRGAAVPPAPVWRNFMDDIRQDLNALVQKIASVVERL